MSVQDVQGQIDQFIADKFSDINIEASGYSDEMTKDSAIKTSLYIER